ncbi:MAG: restriction endonuclease subunit S [Prolixibacteraceae bacterium]|nr:restriction endonuclease subunit S [Prolixibacteraceae bacterium]
MRIGEFLHKSRNQILIEDGRKYQRVTIKINNGGVIPRDVELGENIGTKQQFIVSEGQFLMSKIDARNGAFGIVPKELEGAIVTNDFPTFEVNEKIINPEFLVLITTTKEFIKFAQSCSSGTTNRQRIDISSFLNVKIPLPTLEEQNQIVQAYNDRIIEAKRLEGEAKSLEKGIKKYLFDELGVVKSNSSIVINGLSFLAYKEIERWALSHLLKQRLYSFRNVKHPILPIKTLLIFFEGGKTPSTSRNDFWGGDIYWTSAKDMKELYLKSAQDKITKLAVKEGGLKVYPKGTLLGVFRSGILRHSFPVALTEAETAINQDLKAMGINEEIVLKNYFLNYLNVFQKMILERSQKEGVTVESINTDEFLEIPVIIPPIETQRIISAQIQSIRNEVANKKSQAETNRQLAITEFESKIFMPCN